MSVQKKKKQREVLREVQPEKFHTLWYSVLSKQRIELGSRSEIAE